MTIRGEQNANNSKRAKKTVNIREDFAPNKFMVLNDGYSDLLATYQSKVAGGVSCASRKSTANNTCASTPLWILMSGSQI